MSGEFEFTRREFIRRTAGAAAAGLGISATRGVRASTPRLSVVCVGAHPDDPESGCGGTLARYADAGHRVTVIYLTRGERGIEGKSLDEAAAMRTDEANAACKILGA